MSARRVWLVSYDIGNRRRWRRVYRALNEAGEWIQLSVFLCRLPPARMLRLVERLRGLIDAAEDRLMVVDLGPADSGLARIGGTAAPAREDGSWPRLV